MEFHFSVDMQPQILSPAHRSRKEYSDYWIELDSYILQ